VAVETIEDEGPAAQAEGSEGSLAEGAGEDAKLDSVVAYYGRYAEYIESVYTRFVAQNSLDFREILERMKGLYELVSENKKLVLRAQSLVPPNANYLVSHAVRSSIISIILGQTLKLPAFRLMELGAAAVLHEMGMVKLPPQLYMAGRTLTPVEKRSVTTHTILGYNLLRERQVPLSVCIAVLEHHERMNGSGYPRGLPGDKISLYARIIMVACSYDALTSVRPYKEAKDGYAGMVDMLRNEGKQYDEIVIKALVYSLSIYPIGSHVLLTNGKRALVIDVNSDNPRYPVVQVIGQRTPDGKEIIVKTSEIGVRVLRPLTRNEIADLGQKTGA
jgi:HD-GYP domain-containing protein (c-di-GMP phosphodiesterase class II)